MSDWLTVVCVRVCWVKVGYSLLLGHVANPLTLAWILLTDPFSSNKTHTPPWRSRPPGLGYRCQSARAARRSFHIVATLKHPLLPTTTLQICFFCLFVFLWLVPKLRHRLSQQMSGPFSTSWVWKGLSFRLSQSGGEASDAPDVLPSDDPCRVDKNSAGCTSESLWKCPHDYARGLNWHEDNYRVCLSPMCPTVYSGSFHFVNALCQLCLM